MTETLAVSGKRIVIVGASSGIGRVAAEQALADGARVIVVARREKELVEVFGSNDSAHPVVADLDDPASGETVVAAINEHLGAADAVLIAAGRAPLRRVADTEDADWQQVLQTNLIGVHRVIQTVLPAVVDDGIILCMSSESVGEGRLGLAAYSASKAALEQLLRSWRAEQHRVRIGAVVVGATFPTDFGRDFGEELLLDALSTWSARGQLPAEAMPTEEVGAAVVGVIGAALVAPKVGFETVVLRSASAPAAPDSFAV
jgi:NAD(P)-dependent dehydrogenase (short-subunit alcohol dehydrogenase family)